MSGIPPGNRWWIERLFLRGEVHLLAGQSGANKTTWIFSVLKPALDEGRLFGRAIHGTRFIYIVGDRSRNNIEVTCEDLKIDYRNFPILVLREMRVGNLSEIEGEILRRYGQVDLVIVDPILLALGDKTNTNDYGGIAREVNKWNQACQRNQWTVLATWHWNKDRGRDTPTDVQDRIMGSAGLVAYAGTWITMERDKDDATHRILTIQSHHAGRAEHHYRLIIEDEILRGMGEVDTPRPSNIRASLEALAPNEHIKFSDIATIARVSKRTLFRAIREAEQDGLIERVRAGLWVRRNSLP